MDTTTTPGKTETLPMLLARRIRQDLQFSRIFTVDLVATAAYLLATVAFYKMVFDPAMTLESKTFLVVLCGIYVLLHAGKIGLIFQLERKGGDARQFVGSGTLVQDGVYGWSRNPVYLVSIVQSAVWSVALVCLAASTGMHVVAALIATGLAYAHFWGIDRLVIPSEEAALKAVHPDEFAAYSAKVNRWFGHRAA